MRLQTKSDTRFKKRVQSQTSVSKPEFGFGITGPWLTAAQRGGYSLLHVPGKLLQVTVGPKAAAPGFTSAAKQVIYNPEGNGCQIRSLTGLQPMCEKYTSPWKCRSAGSCWRFRGILAQRGVHNNHLTLVWAPGAGPPPTVHLHPDKCRLLAHTLQSFHWDSTATDCPSHVH